MNDGIRDELRELLFDSAPAPQVDTAAMFERTFAASGPDGAELLPPDGLFDLPADDPAEDLLVDDQQVLDDGFDDAPDDPAADEAGDLPVDTDHADPAWDTSGDAADTGDVPDTTFDDHGTGAGW